MGKFEKFTENCPPTAQKFTKTFFLMKMTKNDTFLT